MRTSILTIAGLAAISHGASISCGPPLSNGTLWYGNSTHRTFDGQIGVLEAYGNAELLAKYPNSYVEAHTIQVIPCNSTYLNATIPAAGSRKPTPVILQLADDTSNCLALESEGGPDGFITKQACQYSDDDSVTQQFWTRTFKHKLLFPQWESKPAEQWNIQFNEYDTEEVIANGPQCFDGQTCQNGTHYSFLIKESS